MTPINNHDKTILFYDGVCGLCNNLVKWSLKHDTKRVLKYSEIQSSYGEEFLSGAGVTNKELQDLKTVYLSKNGQLLKKSTAIATLLQELPLPWKIIGTIIKIIPSPIRDLGYDIVAKNRYRIFGKIEKNNISCEVPSKDVIESFKKAQIS
jgi:predicted DCC family thiol-disulfide oxidoreductase YuxK